jgi:hypothetical protein
MRFVTCITCEQRQSGEVIQIYMLYKIHDLNITMKSSIPSHLHPHPQQQQQSFFHLLLVATDVGGSTMIHRTSNFCISFSPFYYQFVELKLVPI